MGLTVGASIPDLGALLTPRLRSSAVPSGPSATAGGADAASQSDPFATLLGSPTDHGLRDGGGKLSGGAGAAGTLPLAGSLPAKRDDLPEVAANLIGLYLAQQPPMAAPPWAPPPPQTAALRDQPVACPKPHRADKQSDHRRQGGGNGTKTGGNGGTRTVGGP